MGAVFSICPHLFFILSAHLLALGQKKEFGLSPDIPNPRLFLTNLLSTIHYLLAAKLQDFIEKKAFSVEKIHVNVCKFE